MAYDIGRRVKYILKKYSTRHNALLKTSLFETIFIIIFTAFIISITTYAVYAKSHKDSLVSIATIHANTKNVIDKYNKNKEEEAAKKEQLNKKPTAIQSNVTAQTTTIVYTANDLKVKGVINWGGYRYTWYSEKVLPGTGLNIPGRHSDGNFVRDVNNYICLASSELAKGTIVTTPWGQGKIYDSGCAKGTIDVYVSW